MNEYKNEVELAHLDGDSDVAARSDVPYGVRHDAGVRVAVLLAVHRHHASSIAGVGNCRISGKFEGNWQTSVGCVDSRLNSVGRLLKTFKIISNSKARDVLALRGPTGASAATTCTLSAVAGL